MTKTELLQELKEAAEYQMRAAEGYLKQGNRDEYVHWCGRAQVLGWALARLERLDSLD